MRLKTTLILSMIILFLSIGLVAASDNATDADGQTISVNGTSYEDIQMAVDSFADNDVLELDGYFSGTRNKVKIDKNITLKGINGATLDGKKLTGFEVKSDVVFKDLIFKNSGDSAISFTPEENRHLTIINCTFYHNGGLECGNGGAIFSNMGSFTIINSTFDDNKADWGSAIYCWAYESPASEIINCTFINHAGDDALHIYGDVNIIDSIFENNTCTAIESQQKLNVSNSRFINNTGNYGGAISCLWGNVSVSKSYFDRNSAKYAGGCIYSRNDLNSDDVIGGTIDIFDSRIINSDAGGNGDAIYAVFTNIFLNYTYVSDQIYQDIGEFDKNLSMIDALNRTAKHKAKLKASDFTTTYDSQYDGWRISLTDEDIGESMEDRKITLKVFTGKTSKEYNITTWDDDYGAYACLWIDKNFTLGKHKVIISSPSRYYDAKSITAYLTINKAKTIVKAPEVTAKYKKAKDFKVTIKNKASYERVGKIKIKIKVYTGKKYKVYKVKTNKKGVATISTKKLKRGTHKVKITSLNKNYSISKTSKIIIR